MPAAAAIDPLVVFLARCEARAHLCAAGLYTLQESVDTLWAAAERADLVKTFGADEIQGILAASFAEVE